MAGTMPKVIDDSLLRCKLCVNTFTEPKILPCLHIFCKSCLAKYVGSIPKERHKSTALDPQVIEEALHSQAGCGLDQEIPIHGYDDVVGNYPSLPKSARQSGVLRLPSRVEGEYSEVASPEEQENGQTNNLSHSVYTLEKSTLPPNPTGKQSFSSSSHRSRSDPIDERKVQHLQSSNQQSHSARSSKVVVVGEQDSVPGKRTALDLTLQRTDTYLPMDRGSQRELDKSHVVDNRKKKHQQPLTEGTTATLNKAYEVMGNNNRRAGGRSSEKQTEQQPPAAEASGSNVPVDKPLSLITATATTPDSYDVSALNSQSMQLTGFGLASPVPMSLFKNNTKTPSTTPVNPESVYQVARAASNADTTTGGTLGLGLSKRTSQSVDMLSSTFINTEGNNKLTKQSSEGDLKGLQLSLMTHSLSTGNIDINEDHTVASSSSDQTIIKSQSSGEKLAYSPTSGHDGYETPLTQRKMSNEPEQSTTPVVVGSPPLMQTVKPTPQINGNATPSLPPKQHGSASERFSWTGDAVSLQAIQMGPAPPIPRTTNENSGGDRRRLAVRETLSPTQSDQDSIPDTWRDSVFVDHIYEEIQYNTTSQRPPRRGRGGSGGGGGKSHHTNVPMMRPLTRSTKSNKNNNPPLSPQKGGGAKKTPVVLPREEQEEYNPRLHKAKSVLKRTKPQVPPKSPAHHNTSGCKSTMHTGGSLQVGNNLMRKSSVLLDPESGFPYISDHFEKVPIHHNNEDIELIYAEVSDAARQPRPPVPIYASDNTSSESNNSISSIEVACPTCQSLFQLANSGDVGGSLPSCTFIENLKETRDLESTLRPSCQNCKQQTAGAKFKCLECDKYLCKRCNDTHKWFKVVQGHQVMTLSELQSGKYTSQIMASKKQDVCPNHCNEPSPQFYCDACELAICKECAHCYHRGHPCLPIAEVAERGTALLGDFPSMTAHIADQYRQENLQLDKYRLQYGHEKKVLASEVYSQYAKATQLLEDSYRELLRHVEKRYTEEAMYVDEVQQRNEQFLTRIEQTNKLADHVSEFGNGCDVIHMTKLLTQSLLSMESSSNCQPARLETKMEVQFNPLSSVRAIDVLPLLGQASREYKPIKKVGEKLVPSDSSENDWGVSVEPIKHLHTFTPKTDSDKKGCKPTGIALTRDDNIVLVDDINRKIKIFTEEGNLVHEIVPTNREELVDPWDVTVTNYGNFAVTDRGSKRVKIFDPDGDLVCEFGPHLASPWGICCNHNGDLIVTDTDHRCVFIHDSNGNLRFRVNAPAKLAKFPEYVATNSMGDIIVSDLKAHCVYVFNLLGQFLFKVGPNKDTKGSTKANGAKGAKVKVFHSPCGVYADADDNILVADYEMVRVSKFDRNGRFLSHFLTYSDSLQAPQSLIVNRKGHVVLSDGNFVKTFAIDQAEKCNLELKPKVYNRSQTKSSEPPQHPAVARPHDKGDKKLVAEYGQRRQQETSTSKSEDPHHPAVTHERLLAENGEAAATATVGGSVRHVPATPAISDPVSPTEERRSRASRSASTPRQLGNSRDSTLPHTYGTPALLLRAIQDYDTPRVSVKKIKERLTSIDRSNSGRSRCHYEYDDWGGAATPNERGTPNPVIRNNETSKVSIDKVKEQLLLSQDSGSNGNVGPKPKLQPKPSFKQITEHMKSTGADHHNNKKTMVAEGLVKGPVKAVAPMDSQSHAIMERKDSDSVSDSVVAMVTTKTESKPQQQPKSSEEVPPVKEENKGDPGVKKVMEPEFKVIAQNGLKTSEKSNKGSVPDKEVPEASIVIKQPPKETVTKKSADTTKKSAAPLKAMDKKKLLLKASPSISRKEQKSKKSPKLFRTGRKLINKGAASES